MAKQSKSLRAAYEKVGTEVRSVEEAVKLMKEVSTVKFDATAEVHFTLGIDPRHADQQIRTTTTLPHGTGKSVRVAVFCEDDKVAAAKAAGAVEAGGEALIEKVTKGWLDFDVAVSTPTMMRKLAKIARTLGPKGLMPNPKAGTVGDDVAKIVAEVAGGRLEFRNDKTGLIHTIFGKLSFTDEQLIENLNAMIKAVKDAKPTGAKGLYILKVTITSSMGPGIKVSV